MNPLLKLSRGAALAALLGTLLTACGGGSDNPAPPSTAVDTTHPPASASASTDGQVAYVASLSATTSETGDPVILDDYTPPMDTSETAPPVATSADDV
jgi:ABC-type glycerol-3-phosphate transport system substrate-binding protein